MWIVEMVEGEVARHQPGTGVFLPVQTSLSLLLTSEKWEHGPREEIDMGSVRKVRGKRREEGKERMEGEEKHERERVDVGEEGKGEMG